MGNLIEVEPEFDRCIQAIGGQRVTELVGKSPDFSNADYVFERFSVVAELKCLEENKGEDERLKSKVHELYNEMLRSGEIDQRIYGELEVYADAISPRFGRRVIELYRKPVQRVIEKANRQIREFYFWLTMVMNSFLLVR